MHLRKGFSGMSKPEDGAAGETSNRLPRQNHERRQVSVIGLSIVSALNIVCLALVAFHHLGHGSNANQSAANDRSGTPETLNPIPPRLSSPSAIGSDNPHPVGSVGVLGNIDFAHVEQRIIAIASGVEEATLPSSEIDLRWSSAERAGQQADFITTEMPKTDSGFWVQLGALSKETTAKSYWSHLSKKHAGLLNGQTPRYYGPDDVGGSMYHLRVGPMASDQAEWLCESLQSEGADCFCVAPP